MAENVRVLVRCRPMDNREHNLKCRNIIKIEDCTLAVDNPLDLTAPSKSFTYDSVYGPVATTAALYQDICYALVENVLEGYNGTIFAYGQTGCGKTHTMQGPDAAPTVMGAMSQTMDAQRGIIARSFDHIFETISLAVDVRYLALVSYLEIYNENIRDLLNPHESPQANHQLKELPQLGVVVPTLTTHLVHDAHECYSLLNLGNSNRVIGATLMNAQSSRSHSIFTISLEQIRNDDGAADAETAAGAVLRANIRRGKLNLVDLAGSERQNKTGAAGERLKEATKINLSLSALGNVISALVDGKTKHIPYRDSKLTRLLQDSLGGNTKTLMIACISPADSNYDETLSTLRYASRAKNIANKPMINEDPKDAKLREYQAEILKLKTLLQQQDDGLTATDDAVGGGDAAEIDLQQKMAAEMETLRTAHAQQRSEKEELLVKMAQLSHHYEERMQQQKQQQQQHQQQQQQQLPLDTDAASASAAIQLETRQRIEAIKARLIGGERANDAQLRARRQKKKQDAQRRLSALATALSRVAQREDRDLLQVHYTTFQQELEAKNEHLKRCAQKIRALEREVSDLQAEFQMDRADYLETIRRLDRQLRFFQQLMERALPVLRKDGKYWEPAEIMRHATWNDDLKIWRLPETAMNSLKFPPPRGTRNAWEQQQQQLQLVTNNNNFNMKNDGDEGRDSNNNNNGSQPDIMATQQINGESKLDNSHKSDVLQNYFRTPRLKLSDFTRNSQRMALLPTRQLPLRPNFIEQYFKRPNILNANATQPYHQQQHHHSATALLPVQQQQSQGNAIVSIATAAKRSDPPLAMEMEVSQNNGAAWCPTTLEVTPATMLPLHNTWAGGNQHPQQQYDNSKVQLMPLISLISTFKPTTTATTDSWSTSTTTTSAQQ